MESNCSFVGSTIWAMRLFWPPPGTICFRSGTCGAGARFTSRPSFSMRKWSRGGGTGRTEPFSYKNQKKKPISIKNIRKYFREKNTMISMKSFPKLQKVKHMIRPPPNLSEKSIARDKATSVWNYDSFVVYISSTTASKYN